MRIINLHFRSSLIKTILLRYLQRLEDDKIILKYTCDNNCLLKRIKDMGRLYTALSLNHPASIGFQ